MATDRHFTSRCGKSVIDPSRAFSGRVVMRKSLVIEAGKPGLMDA
jgi:hypothetical protein